MAFVTVNGIKIEVPTHYTVLQACEAAGFEIPRFCYHERLQIAGNCRMCLVKVDKMPKPVASCAQPISEGMTIYTDSQEVKEARQGVLEFMLINHPLDCPICDQAGECDLQDQSVKYGQGDSIFTESKRAVQDKYMGPLIKTFMNRCIHCTRCIRFLEDIAGSNELGAVGRGEDMQISTYIEKAITSELSGNIIDLCPVGALTSKPYSFKARSWELTKTESIDVHDAVGSNIRIDSRGSEVMRILPKVNDQINEEWISDKTRFACDGLKYQRLDTPMLKINGKFEEISWTLAIKTIANLISTTHPKKIGMIAGDLVDVESMCASKTLLKELGSTNYDCRQDGTTLNFRHRSDYIFNTTIANIEKADLCLIIGSNPRLEAPIVNARIRKSVTRNNLNVMLIGQKVDLNYDYKHLGDNPWLIKQIADNSHPICKNFLNYKNPMIIIGGNVLVREDANATVYHAKKLCSRFGFIRSDWNGYNVLQNAASRVGGLDIGFIPDENGLSFKNMLNGEVEVLFLLNADEMDLSNLREKTKIIYIGHHGDRSAAHADLILPSPAYTEKDGTFVNLEGRVQHARSAVPPIGDAKSEWEIFSLLAKELGIRLPSTLQEVRSLMCEINSVFKTINVIEPFLNIDTNLGRSYDFTLDSFSNPMSNFYMTNSIARNSPTMAKCSKELVNE